MKIKILRVLAILLLLFLGLGGIYGGWMLIIDPGGGNFGFPPELLHGTPFSNYLVPGIVLLLFIGILPVYIAIISILKKKYYTWWIIAQSLLLLGWLTAELIFNPDFFVPVMHYTFYGTGAILLLTGLLLVFKRSH